MKNKKENSIEAEYRGSSRTFGFACIAKDTPYEEEVYISQKDSMNAMDGDTVSLVITKEKYNHKKSEGKIVKILKRKTDTVVGVFETNKDFAFVTPLSKKITFDLHIEKKFFKNATNGSIVECKILDGAKVKKNNNPEGMILNVIGHKNDPNANIVAIIKGYNIPYEFDKEVLDEAENIAKEIDKNDIIYRKDLRNIITVTIDGEDAKDLDDAVSLVDLPNGNKKLYVSIADVSHYVKENSFIDVEAKKRGNSVYLVDRVIPMLPKVLCNGICSLNEKEDRLTKTCEIEFDENANIVDYNIYESVINSDKRMTYTGVHYILANEDVRENSDDILRDGVKFEKEDFSDYEPYRKMLESMYDLSLKIRKRRFDEGAIDFNTKECKIIVDEELNPIIIEEYKKYESHEMIEDFMLIANEIVAKDYCLKEIPFLYRIHEECDGEKIQNLINILPSFNLSLSYRNKLHPMDIQKLLKKVKGKNEEYVVSRLTLRSMQQAKYSVSCEGHFGLALQYYTHFTSPIRRYSDLQIHRIIGEDLHQNLDEKRMSHYDKILPNIALSTSINERKAIECERDVDALMQCKYMKNKIGEEYEGIISSITNFGIFVELSNTIEGMIPLKSLIDDYYIFDEQKIELYGEKTKKIYKLGMKLNVKLVNVNEEIKAIDFSIME